MYSKVRLRTVVRCSPQGACRAVRFRAYSSRTPGRVIVAFGFAAHAGMQSVLLERLAVSRAGMLHPTIGVMKDQVVSSPASNSVRRDYADCGRLYPAVDSGRALAGWAASRKRGIEAFG
jgi:hypothetical protein